MSESRKCAKCGQEFKGFGDTCSACRKAGLKSQGTARACEVCGAFFSGFGSTCEDCPTPAEKFDLIVVGGGSGGSAVARRATGYGAKVCIIERGVSYKEGVRQGAGIGGTCVNVGCVPKKIMFMAAQWREGLVGEISTAKGFGYTVPEEAGRLDWANLKKKRDAYVAKLNKSYTTNWDKEGVAMETGLASFVDRNGIKIALADGTEKVVTAPHIVLACGGEPALPNIPGKELAISSDGFFDLETQPKKVAVVGAGYIAVEMAGILHGLGSESHLFFRGDTVLRRGFDPFIVETLMDEMKAHGPHMHGNCSPVKLEKAVDGTITYTVKTTAGEEVAHTGFDCVLMAIGRRPVTDLLNVESVGIGMDDKGLIDVDQYENTSVQGIYAIGDCTTTGFELTPVAIAAGRRLSDRIFGGEPKARIAYETIATVVFSHPPIGVVGYTEPAARQEFGAENVVVKEAKFGSMAYAFNDDDKKVKTGLKLVLKLPEERVVGLHCIGPSSDEMMQGFAIAVRMGATRADFEASVAIHPTIGEEFVTFGGWGQVKGADGKMKPQLAPYVESCCPPGSWPAVSSPDTYRAKGHEAKIGELPVYHVGAGDRGILVLPDIFGWSQNTGRFFGIADTLAEQGFNVLLTDPFYGDTAEGKADMFGWIKSFPWEKVGKDVGASVKWLQDHGCTSVGAVGFCWGVWAGCKAASEAIPIKCMVGLHPSSHLEAAAFGGDEKTMYEKAAMPILLMPAGGDPASLKEGGEIAELVVKMGGQSITFPEMAHGWSCRGDLSDPAVKRDTELAMKHAVDFLQSKL